MEKKPAGKASPGAGQKRKADAKEEEQQEGVVKSPFFGGKAKSDSGSQEKAGKRKATRHNSLNDADLPTLSKFPQRCLTRVDLADYLQLTFSVSKSVPFGPGVTPGAQL